MSALTQVLSVIVVVVGCQASARVGVHYGLQKVTKMYLRGVVVSTLMDLLIGDIFTCHSIESTGVTHNTDGGSAPFRHPRNIDIEMACTASAGHWNWGT